MIKPSLVTWCHGTALGVEHLGEVGILETFPHLGLAMIANVSVLLTTLSVSLLILQNTIEIFTKPGSHFLPDRKMLECPKHGNQPIGIKLKIKDNDRIKIKNLLLGPDHRNQSIGVNSNCQRLLSSSFSHLGW